MSAPHIQAVELAEDGVVVIFDDATCAFYHESVLQAHLQQPDPQPAPAVTKPKPVRRAARTVKTSAS